MLDIVFVVATILFFCGRARVRARVRPPEVRGLTT